MESLSFDSALTPEEVLDGFESLAQEEGWKVGTRTDIAVAAKTGVSLRTWGENIEISAIELAAGGSHVQVIVHSWQLADWGKRADVILTIRRRLS